MREREEESVCGMDTWEREREEQGDVDREKN